MNPLLLELPMPIKTNRLLIRPFPMMVKNLRLGFMQEARLHHNMRKAHDNSLRNTLIYTRHNTQNLPDSIVHW